MSVLIPGMEMPKSCGECRFFGDYCYAKGDEDRHSKRPCPLIPVPPHGRLIDADAAIRYLSVILDPVVAPKACGVIAGMSAIIPAEEGE